MKICLLLKIKKCFNKFCCSFLSTFLTLVSFYRDILTFMLIFPTVWPKEFFLTHFPILIEQRNVRTDLLTAKMLLLKMEQYFAFNTSFFL